MPSSKRSVPPTQVIPGLRGFRPLGVAVNAAGVKLAERATRLLIFVYFFARSSLTSSLFSPFLAAGRSAVKASFAEATSRDFCARPAICNQRMLKRCAVSAQSFRPEAVRCDASVEESAARSFGLPPSSFMRTFTSSHRHVLRDVRFF